MGFLTNIMSKSSIVQLVRLSGGLGIRKKFAFLGLFAGLLGVLFESVSMFLLIPTLEGILKMDFSFVKSYPFAGEFIANNPDLFMNFNTVIFAVFVVLIFCSIILKNVFSYLSYVLFSSLRMDLSVKLREKIFNQYLSFGKKFFDDNNRGYLYNILSSQVASLTNRLEKLFTSLTNFLMLLGYLTIMFFISWKLTLLSFLVFPAFHFFLGNLVNLTKESSRSQSEKSNFLQEFTHDVLSSIQLIKLYNTEKKEEKRYYELNDELYKLEYEQNKRIFLFCPLQEIIMIVFTILLVSAMAFFIVKEQASVAGFLVFVVLLRRASGNFGSLAGLRMFSAEISGYLHQILYVLDSKDKPFVKDGKKEFKGLKKDIEFRNVFFSYKDGVPVLTGVSFSVKKGSVTAVVGPSGSGKTTLVNLLARFYDIPDSRIFIDSVDINEYKISSLRSHFSMVSQDLMFFNDTIKNNLVYGLNRDVSDEVLYDVLKKTRLFDFVMKLPKKMETVVGDRGVKLSGGEKQRLAIARALLSKSEVLILDEATSSLDSKTEILVQDAVNEALKGRTSIVIAHRLSTIKHADKIVVVENGCVVEEGTLNHLLEKKGKFYEYWKAQNF